MSQSKKLPFLAPIKAVLEVYHDLDLEWPRDLSSNEYSTLLTQPAVSTRDLGVIL